MLALISKKRLLRLAILLIVGGLLLAAVGLRKTITIVVDGVNYPHTTWALTVKQALADAEIPLALQDQVVPGLQSRLRNGDMISIERASAFQIEADGQLMTIVSSQRIPSAVLREAGIVLSSQDKLLDGVEELPLNQEFQTHRRIQHWRVQRAVSFTLKEGSQTTQLTSSAATVGEALWEHGVAVQAGDHLEPGASTPLKAGMEVYLERGRPIVVTTPQSQIELITAAGTVAEAIQDAGLSLQNLDYTIPSDQEPVPLDGKIQLVHVREEVLIEQTPIPFETTYQPVATLEIDHQTVLEPGQYGIEAKRIRVRYENNQEVSRQVEETWLAQPPQNQVIGYGTQLVMRSIETPDGTVNYWRSLQVYATSYYPSAVGGSITSTGQQLKKGIIAVNPRYIPYGTVLYVPGYGYGVAADTGRLGPRHIDLGYSDEDYVGWHHNVTIYFVWPPPENIVWIIP